MMSPTKKMTHASDIAITPTNTTINLGIDGFPVAFEDGVVAFAVWERMQGQTDLNGDGDTNDFVFHLAKLP